MKKKAVKKKKTKDDYIIDILKDMRELLNQLEVIYIDSMEEKEKKK